MQPYLFPNLGYFQLIHLVDRFVIYDDVNFIKQGWINRNRILVAGRDHLFTLPISKISSFSLINEVLVEKGLYPNWREKFLRSLSQAYARAPHKTETIELVESVLAKNASHISTLAKDSLEAVAKHVGLATEFVQTSSVYKNVQLKAQERVIDICRIEKAAHYINPQGGKDLYDHPTFQSHGIRLSFVQPGLRPYRQMNNEFVPGLSIIDVLMFNPKEKVLSMMGDADLN